jgi:ABC-type transport system involved in cytochrome bd biosynthesis fused ATPase/permease subunit
MITWKHWQLFLLITIIPFILMVIVSVSAPLPLFAMLCFWVELISVLIFSVWLYTTAKELHARFPKDLKVRLGTLILSLIIPVSMIVFLTIKHTLRHLTNHDQDQARLAYSGVQPLLGIVYFIAALLGMLYAIYFVARSIKTVEAGKRVPFYHCIDLFIAILFFPIGVWAIAPRLNKIAAKQEEPEMDIFTS